MDVNVILYTDLVGFMYNGICLSVQHKSRSHAGITIFICQVRVANYVFA